MERVGRQILGSLLRGHASFWQLYRENRANLLDFVNTMNSLHRRKLIKTTTHGILVTEKGRRIAHKAGLTRREKFSFNKCFDSMKRDENFRTVLARFKKIAKNRPKPIEEFNQGFVRSEDTVKRAVFMNENADVDSRKIVIVGDDDLLSLALCLVKHPKEVRVIEIDERINDFINKKAKRHGFHVHAQAFNVENPLPKKLARKFDVFVTDPVETLPGIELFLSRGVEALKGKGSAMYFGLTNAESSLRKWYEIQKRILQMNFVVTDLLPDFAWYPEKENDFERFYQTYSMMKMVKFPLTLPERDWYSSAFVRCEAIAKPKPLIKGRKKIDAKMHFDKEAIATPSKK